MDIAGQLGRSDVFAGLGLDRIMLIAERFDDVKCKAGDTLFTEGDRGDSFYVISKGEMIVLKGTGICQRELARMGPGEVFGEMALISHDPRTATLKSLTDTTLLRLKQDDFTILMDQDERFAQRILRLISRRLRQTTEVASLDLLQAHKGLIISLAKLAESRDADTGAHLYRVRDYSTLLSKLMAEDELFADEINSGFIDAIYHVSPLHDIGKVAIPDGVLKKKGKLTDEEFDVIKGHTTIGAESLDIVLGYCDLDMFHMARDIVVAHHERYDGAGYPAGLKGDAIPLAARIMTIVDFYDALLSVRVYKEAFTHEKVIEAIREETGKKFDGRIAAIMLNNIDQFYAIHLEYADKDAAEG
jgi:response regulator RpfG family c-di-GMP phosphodiesterase